jgi:hypothetical protein
MPGGFCRLRQAWEIEMPQFSVKLITYDPVLIEAFESLRKARKQASFTNEALKHFLATEKGKQVLSLMKGKPSEQFPTTVTLSIVPPCVGKPVERRGVTSNQVNDSSSVLDSILK